MKLVDDIVTNNIKQITLAHGIDYKEQIEEVLQHYAELYHTSVPLKKLKYTIVKEYTNTAVAELNSNGEIEVCAARYI